MTFAWNPTSIETLKKMRVAGHSSSQIAEAIGTSRNAVIGKAKRLGIPASIDNLRKAGQGPKVTTSKRAPIDAFTVASMVEMFSEGHSHRAIASRLSVSRAAVGARLRSVGAVSTAPRIRAERACEPVDLPESRGLSIIDLGAHDCRFPTGEDDGTHLFCGALVKEKSSYCPGHHAICYRSAA
jgi:GcrA cell cycle regulator